LSTLYDLFLSHSSTDAQWVQRLHDALQALGIRVYLCTNELLPGGNFVLALDDALRDSRFLAVVLSRASIDAPWVVHEWTAFRAKHGPLGRVIPILLEPVSLPVGLAATQVLDATDRDADRVAAALAHVLGKQPDDAAPALPSFAPELTFVVRADARHLDVLSASGRIRRSTDRFPDALRVDLHLFHTLARSGVSDAQEREQLDAYARAAGRALYNLLFDDESKAALDRAVASGLIPTIIIVSDDEGVLAIPWELLHDGERFLVRDGAIDLVRTTRSGSFASLPAAPTEPLRLLVSVAAPREHELNYEEESYRISRILADRCDMMTSELGTVDDLIRTSAASRPSGVHFSGHGAPGALVFETDENDPEAVPIARLVQRLRTETPGGLPRFFYLGCCHGNTEAPAISAAHLHAEGIPEVVAYSGPIVEHLETRAEQAMYVAIAAGETTRFAVRQARLAMIDESKDARHPFAWSQLVLYRRGPEHPLSPSVVTTDAREPVSALIRTFQDAGNRRMLRSGFIGRRTELHTIRRRFREGSRVFVFHGMGGLGKTTLAIAALSLLAASEDVCVVWCEDLAAHADPGDTLAARIADYARQRCGVAVDAVMLQLDRSFPDDLRSRCAGLLDFLVQRVPNLVLYLDNMESLMTGPLDSTADLADWRSPELQALWRLFVDTAENGGRLRLVASTRYYNDSIAGRHRFPVPPLGRDALFRFMKWLPALRRLSAATRAQLVERLAGHPRAVELADALVNHAFEAWEATRGPWTSSDPADEWRLLVEPVFPNVQQRLEADLLLDAIWDRVLDDAARRMLFRFTVIRADRWSWELGVALSVEDLDHDMAEVTARRLVQSSLLIGFDERVSDTVGRVYKLHPSTASFVRRRFGEAAELERETHRRLGGLVFANLSTAPPPELERYVFLSSEASHHLFQAGEHDLAARAIGVGCERLLLAGQVRRVLQLLDPFVAGHVEIALSPGARATVFDQSARAFRMMEAFDDALRCHELSMAAARESGPEETIVALSNLANLYLSMKRFDRALELLREARELARVAGDRLKEITHLCNMGTTLSDMGRYDEAIACFAEAFERAGGVENAPVEDLELNLGTVLARQGRDEEAIPHFRTAARLAGPARKSMLENRALYNIAQSLLSKKRFDEAAASASAALGVARDIGEPRRQADALKLLASIAEHAKDWPRFFDHGHEFLRLARKLERHDETGAMLLKLAKAFGEHDSWPEAVDASKEAIREADASGDSELHLEAWRCLAAGLHALRDLPGQLHALQRAVAISVECGNAAAEIDARMLLASVWRDSGDALAMIGEYDRAWHRARSVDDEERERRVLEMYCYCVESAGAISRLPDFLPRLLELERKVGNPAAVLTALGLLGIGLMERRAWTPAGETLHEALALARELGDRDAEAASLDSLGTLYRSTGDHRNEALHYEQALELVPEPQDRAILLGKLGRAYLSLAEFDRAVASLEEAVRIRRDAGDLASAVRPLINAGVTRIQQERWPDAVRLLDEGVRLVEQIGDRGLEAMARVNLGMALAGMGASEGARAELERGRALAAELGLERARDLASTELAKLSVILTPNPTRKETNRDA
jgi:tetratricopeptide (TPR) repeat protein